MLYLTKKADYAFKLLIYLAKSYSKTPVNLAKISQKQGFPKSFLAKLAADLVKAKILKSKEGITGGYLLAKPAERISLADIVFALEKVSKNDYQNCNGCSCQFCSKRDVEKPLLSEITRTLQGKTLAEFLRT